MDSLSWTGLATVALRRARQKQAALDAVGTSSDETGGEGIDPDLAVALAAARVTETARADCSTRPGYTFAEGNERTVIK